jgi:hypothetical protein
MPGTVKSELLADADRSLNCGGQEKVCLTLYLFLDKGHFITEAGVFSPDSDKQNG